ncbi:hypothetical protein LAWI1_G003541 [Lachnellula willkommii]|uniref:Uncharacterized protein n=1 Tax=Lachnellula willkommii TaxID=215461 RepID=A0A559M5C9_9HELO|nr:hypothetical protein LAWI1_G003541 [Lachnellula willkommii]
MAFNGFRGRWSSWAVIRRLDQAITNERPFHFPSDPNYQDITLQVTAFLVQPQGRHLLYSPITQRPTTTNLRNFLRLQNFRTADNGPRQPRPEYRELQKQAEIRMAVLTASSTESLGPTDAKAAMKYLKRDTKMCRRYLAPGKAMNTAEFEWKDVVVRDGRQHRDTYSLEKTGFCLVDDPSQVRHPFTLPESIRAEVTDWDDESTLHGLYAAETERLIKRLTGADKVLVFEPTLRRASTTTAWQPFGSEVHADYTARTAHNLLESFLAKSGAPDFPYKRTLCVNVWRALSPGPQDWPLAMCDPRSVHADDSRAMPRVRVEVLPEPDKVPSEEPDPDTPAAQMFYYRPEHSWWYFSDMKADEALVFKLYDSDETSETRRFRIRRSMMR